MFIRVWMGLVKRKWAVIISPSFRKKKKCTLSMSHSNIMVIWRREKVEKSPRQDEAVRQLDDSWSQSHWQTWQTQLHNVTGSELTPLYPDFTLQRNIWLIPRSGECDLNDSMTLDDPLCSRDVSSGLLPGQCSHFWMFKLWFLFHNLNHNVSYLHDL